MPRLYFIGVLVICLSGYIHPLSVSAHGSGASFEVVQDTTLIDIGYTPEQLVAGERVRLDLALYDAVDSFAPDVEFTNVWLRLTKQGRVFFSGNQFNPLATQTVVTLPLPEAGEYELSARFYNEDAIVADAVFPVTIAAYARISNEDEINEEQPSARWLVVATLAGLVGLLVGAYWLGLRCRQKA